MKCIRTVITAMLVVSSCSLSAAEFQPRFEKWQEVIEPDDFEVGADLSVVSPYVKLSTFNGSPVYASPLNTMVGEDPLNGYDSGPLGNQVFSRKPDLNSEWYFLEEGDDLLVATFSEPVVSFSIKAAEINGFDGACCLSDPVILFLYLYDADDNLVEHIAVDSSKNTTITYLGDENDVENAFPVYHYRYAGKPVSRIMIGGESESTTIDGLTFTPLSKLPRFLSFFYSKWSETR